MNSPYAPDGCTPGERVVFNALKRNLPDDYFVWFEPTLFGRRNSVFVDSKGHSPPRLARALLDLTPGQVELAFVPADGLDLPALRDRARYLAEAEAADEFSEEQHPVRRPDAARRKAADHLGAAE
jgi:hypothetical protein